MFICDHHGRAQRANSRAHEGNSSCSPRNLTQNRISRSLLSGIDCGLIFWKGVDTLLHLSTGFMGWIRLYRGVFSGKVRGYFFNEIWHEVSLSAPSFADELMFPVSHPYGTCTVGKPLTRSKRWTAHFRYRARSLEIRAHYLWVADIGYTWSKSATINSCVKHIDREKCEKYVVVDFFENKNIFSCIFPLYKFHKLYFAKK